MSSQNTSKIALEQACVYAYIAKSVVHQAFKNADEVRIGGSLVFLQLIGHRRLKA